MLRSVKRVLDGLPWVGVALLLAAIAVRALRVEGLELPAFPRAPVVDLPDEVDADVDLRVDNGLIRNDRKLGKAVRESNGRMRGRLGRGGALIKLRTSNGSISLR